MGLCKGGPARYLDWACVRVKGGPARYLTWACVRLGLLVISSGPLRDGPAHCQKWACVKLGLLVNSSRPVEGWACLRSQGACVGMGVLAVKIGPVLRWDCLLSQMGLCIMQRSVGLFSISNWPKRVDLLAIASGTVQRLVCSMFKMGLLLACLLSQVDPCKGGPVCYPKWVPCIVQRWACSLSQLDCKSGLAQCLKLDCA